MVRELAAWPISLAVPLTMMMAMAVMVMVMAMRVVMAQAMEGNVGSVVRYIIPNQVRH